MNRCLISASICLAVAALGPNLASADVIVDVDFEDMALNKPLPMTGIVKGHRGGGLEGAIETNVESLERSRWLMIADNDDYAAGAVSFQSPNVREFTQGEVAISADLWFEPLSPGHGFNVYVREHNTAASSFLSLHFDDSGKVSLSDHDTQHRTIANYASKVERPLPLDLIFDMNEGTYEVWLDGELVVEDEAHGVEERGVGSVLFGTEHDADFEGVFYIDNVLMTHERGNRELW